MSKDATPEQLFPADDPEARKIADIVANPRRWPFKPWYKLPRGIPRADYVPPRTADEWIQLYKKCTPAQQRLLALRRECKNGLEACRVSGTTKGTLRVWLALDGPFRTLWHTALDMEKSPAMAMAILEKAVPKAALKVVDIAQRDYDAASDREKQHILQASTYVVDKATANEGSEGWQVEDILVRVHRERGQEKEEWE